MCEIINISLLAGRRESEICMIYGCSMMRAVGRMMQGIVSDSCTFTTRLLDLHQKSSLRLAKRTNASIEDQNIVEFKVVGA